MKANTVNLSGIIDVAIMWTNIVLGVILTLEVIFAGWKLIIILISIMRNTDNPEARANDLGALKWPIIVIIASLVVIAHN
ncbi:Mbov_0395 family pilin-like conjugal transfer protein [Spiroplasma endosymbiont of Polydrusus cervinus]|uniref:Mbov_0395 family pilin-like conjugal transfer protein n=1 Tax=Spiroplasma endosymbiont of Polydrusus cervinus TaxID=3066287 RepID=UPI0030D08996